MSQSSRASIPPLSRGPGPSRPSTNALAQLVWQRHAFLGAGAGFVLSMPALFELGAVRSTPWQPLFLSALFSMALSGLLLGACGSLSWALAVSFPATKKRARTIAALSSSLLIATYVLLRGAAE